MTIKSSFIDYLHKKNFLFFSLIFLLLFLFFAPTHFLGNDYAFTSKALQFFNTNENFIGFSDSNRVSIIRIPLYFYFKFFGFEVGLKIARTLTLVLYALAFYHFSVSFRFSNFTILTGILIFILAGQSVFGTAFIFGTFEFKVISSIAVIFSLSYLQREKYLKSIILISLAIYSHFLVGYFWLGAICFFYYLKEKNFRIIFKYFIIVFSISLPVLLILIYENYYININDDIVNYNKIFLDRHDDLTNPFTKSWNLKKDWIFGYIIILINIFLLFFLKNKIKNNLNNNFFSLIIFLNFYFIFLTTILYFDREFLLAKFIPFRPESLTLLFSLFVIIELKLIFYNKQSLKRKIIILSTLILLFSSPVLFENKYNLIRVLQILIQKAHFVSTNFYKPLSDYLEIEDKELISWAKKNTTEEDIIIFEDGRNYSKIKMKDLILFSRDDNYVMSKLLSSSWETISERPAYVNRDVIGGNIPEVIKWKKRLDEKISIYNGNCEVIKNTSINYIISFSKISKVQLDNCFKKSFLNFGKYNVYKTR